jgi:negative regulator of replication initiation
VRRSSPLILGDRAPLREASEAFVEYLMGEGFRALFTEDDKYLAILGWVAAMHAPEFNEFILGLSCGPSGRSYLGMSHNEVVERCRLNQVRRIPGTHYWAVMNIRTVTKLRFLARVLEFVGYHDNAIDFVCGHLIPGHPSS